MRKTFKTQKGTELPLLQLKGKEYLQVAHRLVWFREEHPEFAIEVEFPVLTDTHAIAKATIRDDRNRILAQGHKREDKAHFPDHMEKAETGAIGRALALLGYGTQFAPELDEEERIVDSPIKPKEAPRAEEQRPGEQELSTLKGLIKQRNWLPASLVSYLEAKYGTGKLGQITMAQYEELVQTIQTKTHTEAMTELAKEKAQPQFQDFK